MEPLRHCRGVALVFLVLLSMAQLSFCAAASQGQAQPGPTQAPGQASPPQTAEPAKSASPKQPPLKSPSELEELQLAINTAGNDRAALVRNLEAFLVKYPESRERPQIYRALVEASLQLRDNARATDYAERIVAIRPEDISMTLLAIQLLERNGDEPALRRALNYSSRVLEYIDRASLGPKSPKISQEEWEAQQKNDKMSVLALRGRLYLKLHDNVDAQKDFQASMAITPTAVAAEKLGEIAELNKDLNVAIKEYAQAFLLSSSAQDGTSRRDIRQKLGNVWRLAHGSDQGLGDAVLGAYDDAVASSEPARPRRNADAKELYEFKLRNARDRSSYSLADQKGKVIVLNFWATWCGPCRETEPYFERAAIQFQGNPDVVFLAADCDEDETLVPAYLDEIKPHTIVVFADGLDRLLGVTAFPTFIVLDRSGKIAYRATGADPRLLESELSSAVHRLLGEGQPGK
jgi:thiol-disulfide isomerase/thioredoxin